MGRLSSARRVRHVTVTTKGPASPHGDATTVASAYRPLRLLQEAVLNVNAHGTRVLSVARVPGHDIELVNGFLFGEGIIQDRAGMVKASFCSGADASGLNSYNTLDVDLDPHSVLRLASYQARHTSVSCGVPASTISTAESTPTITPVVPSAFGAPDILEIPSLARRMAPMLAKTGAGIAAAAFSNGQLHLVREDLGASTAVDKLIGSLLIDDSPTAGGLLFVDAPLTEGVVKHALRAGFSGIAATGSATAAAVEACKQAGAFLATDIFPQAGTFNLHNGALA